MSEITDYYAILHVPRDASPETIERAYQVLSRRYNPKKPNGSEQKIERLNEAYETLSTPPMRAAYDEQLEQAVSVYDANDWVRHHRRHREWAIQPVERGFSTIRVPVAVVIGILSIIALAYI
jgi:curved DNA-binding protein CbpA